MNVYYADIVVCPHVLEMAIHTWKSQGDALTSFSPPPILFHHSNFIPISASSKAEKKGASNTMIGMIFGCYALFELLASLVFGKYVSIGAQIHILVFKNHVVHDYNLLI